MKVPQLARARKKNLTIIQFLSAPWMFTVLLGVLIEPPASDTVQPTMAKAEIKNTATLMYIKVLILGTGINRNAEVITLES